MNQFCNERSLNLIAIIFLLCSMVISTGCANRSAIDFANSNLFEKSSGAISPSDLKVRQSYSKDQTWFESYENAHRESMRTGKPILAAFTGSDWCGPCIKLKKNVFEKPEFKQWAADNVVLLELDFPKKTPQPPQTLAQNKRLAKKYNVSQYPTVLFLDDNGDVMGKQGFGTNAVKWIAAAETKLR